MSNSDMSEGEIVEDLSEISSEENDYFDKLSKEFERRKLELELENSLLYTEKKAGFGKENQYHRQRPSNRQKKKSLSRYESSREVARRSYRASSVFSNYSMPKRRKTKSHRKVRRSKQEFLETTLKKSERKSAKLTKGNSDGESSDEELLELRLTALKSKQEVKELINEENTVESAVPKISKPETEEDNLRIQALKSAVMKRKDIIKRKRIVIKQKLIENERPYSPSDDITLDYVVDDMVLSPLNSPFNEPELDQQEVDMDISYSPLNEEKETSDMDTSPSPNDALAEVEHEDKENNDEEIALRSLLLGAICKKKEVEDTRSSTPENLGTQGEETNAIAMNLKMAVQRLKQKKLVPSTSAKSGNKTIAMILAEKKNRTMMPKEDKQALKSDLKEQLPAAVTTETADVKEKPLVSMPQPDKSLPLEPPEIIPETQKENHLALLPPLTRTISPSIDPDSSISTITDTKTIPLLPATNKVKRSRLITAHVNTPVPRLVITVNADSDTEEEDKSLKVPLKKNVRNIIRAPAPSVKPKPQDVKPGFERNLESFLKNIRMEQEKTSNDKKVSDQTVTKLPEQAKSSSQVISVSVTKAKSCVKHLPVSSQIEYEQLIQKMKVLEEAKQKKLKARHLKRTKSNSTSSEVALQPLKESSLVSQKTPVEIKSQTQKKPVTPTVVTETKTDKIAESLNKIPLLDQGAQQRLIEKTEVIYKTHSDNLMGATLNSLKLLEANEVELERQEKLTIYIADLEQRLAKHKANLNVVNHRVKVNVHKIEQSQRAMAKLRLHQKKFGKTCQQVGTVVRGDSYSIPEHNSTVIEENFKKIASKTEDIINRSSDQNIKNGLKAITDRVKGFIAEKEVERLQETDDLEPNRAVGDGVPCCTDVTEISVALSVPQKPKEEEEEESEVAKMIKEHSNKPETRKEEVPVDLKFPEVQRQTKGVLDGMANGSKRMLGPGDTQGVEKKLKYESPLEFLRLKNKNPSVNKILCPFLDFGGTCNDEKCQMMHI